jgi:hypothetical protein
VLELMGAGEKVLTTSPSSSPSYPKVFFNTTSTVFVFPPVVVPGIQYLRFRRERRDGHDAPRADGWARSEALPSVFGIAPFQLYTTRLPVAVRDMKEKK